MIIKSFSDIEKILSSRRPDIQAVNWFFTLEKMKRFMAELGNPQDEYNVVHVAGTSGKTSTAYYLAKMFELSKSKTGLTVSPHVDQVNERVQIDGASLSEKNFLAYFQKFIDRSEVKSMEITYFGLLVAFAYWVFAQEEVSYAVIEVGMGGRLDATNVINNPNKVCVITDIGLDHTKFLGNNLRDIAREKAGIIQTGQQVFVANQDQEVMEVFKEMADNKNAHLHIMPEELVTKAPDNLPLFQKRNWALAKFAFEFVVTRDGLTVAIEKVIESAETLVPARMQEFKVGDKTIIIDGSHNAQKITALVQSIQQKFPGRKVAVLISMVEGKDSTLDQSLKTLNEISDTIIITEFTGSQDVYRKAIKTADIAVHAQPAGFANIYEITDPVQAFDLLKAQSEEILLVTGSFFLLNHIRPLIIN